MSKSDLYCRYAFFPYFLMYTFFMYKLNFPLSFLFPLPRENKVIDVFSKLPLEVVIHYFSRFTGTNTNIGNRAETFLSSLGEL